MRRRRHKKWGLLLFILSAGFFMSAGGYVLFTSFGADVVTRKVLPRYFPSAVITYESVSGNLARGVVYKNLLIRSVRVLPPGSVLKVQFLGLRVSIFGEKGFRAEVENARLQLPVSEPIMIWGIYDKGGVNATLYSRNVDLKEVHDILAQFKVPTPRFFGTLSDTDIQINGSLSQVTLKGTFRLPQLVVEKFMAQDVVGMFFLRGAIALPVQLDGRLDLSQGTVQGEKTALVKLNPSRLLLHGDLGNPEFDLNGTTVVTDTRIEVFLKGTISQPELQLASQPPLAQDQLLVMLATNRRWRGTQTAVEQGRISVDLAKDFIDYFVFAGMGSDLARQLGISDVSVKFDLQERGFDIQKDLSGSLRATYGIEQTTPSQGTGFTTRKFGGELKLDDSTALGVEQRSKQSTLRPTDAATTAAKEEQIMIKLKKNF